MNFNNYYGKIANSGHDERGRYSGGKAGDQTGTEWSIVNWYNRPWNCILRHPNQKVRQLIAELAIEAANNNFIGYNQANRNSFWKALQLSGYRPANIKIACDADCSAGIIAITKAVGVLTGNSALAGIGATYTGNMRAKYKAAGFQVLTDSKYLTGYNYLLPGDILLNDVHHVAVNLTIGRNTISTPASGGYTLARVPSKTFKWVGQVTATSLSVRTLPGVENPKLVSVPQIYKGGRVWVCDTFLDKTGQPWYYINIPKNNVFGFVSAQYIKRVS